MIGVTVIVLVSCAAGTARMAYPIWQEGSGHARRIWRDSQVLAAARALPPDVHVYTNASDVLYLHAKRAVISPLPIKFDPASRNPNPQYNDELAALVQALKSGRAVVVFCDRFENRRTYFPSSAELRQRLRLRVRVRANDGMIFDLPVAESTRARRQAAATAAAAATQP